MIVPPTGLSKEDLEFIPFSIIIMEWKSYRFRLLKTSSQYETCICHLFQFSALQTINTHRESSHSPKNIFCEWVTFLSLRLGYLLTEFRRERERERKTRGREKNDVVVCSASAPRWPERVCPRGPWGIDCVWSLSGPHHRLHWLPHYTQAAVGLISLFNCVLSFSLSCPLSLHPSDFHSLPASLSPSLALPPSLPTPVLQMSVDFAAKLYWPGFLFSATV